MKSWNERRYKFNEHVNLILFCMFMAVLIVLWLKSCNFQRFEEKLQQQEEIVNEQPSEASDTIINDSVNAASNQ